MGLFILVPWKGLEPSRIAALVPKTSVSTNSTTTACIGPTYFTTDLPLNQLRNVGNVGNCRCEYDAPRGVECDHLPWPALYDCFVRKFISTVGEQP